MRSHLLAAAFLMAAPLALSAQQVPIVSGHVRPAEAARVLKTPQGPNERVATVTTEGAAEAPHTTITLASFASLELTLRGGAKATGLHGFYDYQSNGGSPNYTFVRPGAWDRVYTTFMNSLSGGTETDIADSRRAGYAVTTDGGSTWLANRDIADLKLGYPDIEVSSESIPYVAAHGDLGAGNQVLVYASPDDVSPQAFLALGEMPAETASGRGGRGVIWTSFTLSGDGTKGYLASSYFSDATNPASPLQVGSMDLTTGIGSSWDEIPDSLHSTASGGRYGIARSPSGKLGVVWYHSGFDSLDTEYGIYYSESTDDGVTWSAPAGAVVGQVIVEGLDINGDPDTLSAGANLDVTYAGEDLQFVATGNMNGLLRFANIIHWSKARGLGLVAISHEVEGMGAYSLAFALRQANNGTISYPTIAVGEDGNHIVVVYSAVDQRLDESGTILTSVANEAGFLYYRLWGVGSRDGGITWGEPFLIQDYAGEGTDSASIEFPSAAPIARMVGDNFELNLTFQGKRQPGGFAYVAADQIPGEVEDVYQYFQRFSVTPEMFGAPGSAPVNRGPLGLEITGMAPLPAGGHTILSYRTSGTSVPHVSIIDQLGRTRWMTRDESSRGAGIHQTRLDISTLGSGVYQVMVKLGKETVVRPLSVVK